jgi:hypothetical protein
MKSLQTRILEEQIRRLERELRVLNGEDVSVHVPNELEESKAFTHSRINSGPEYLTVYASNWSLELHTDQGLVKSLEEARGLAEKLGLKGISVKFGRKPECLTT